MCGGAIPSYGIAYVGSSFVTAAAWSIMEEAGEKAQRGGAAGRRRGASRRRRHRGGAAPEPPLPLPRPPPAPSCGATRGWTATGSVRTVALALGLRPPLPPLPPAAALLLLLLLLLHRLWLAASTEAPTAGAAPPSGTAALALAGLGSGVDQSRTSAHLSRAKRGRRAPW